MVISQRFYVNIRKTAGKGVTILTRKVTILKEKITNLRQIVANLQVPTSPARQVI
jgi:hypothetical protein